MKFATSILAIAFIAVPALAASTEQYERSYDLAESGLYDREVDEIVDNLTREDLDEIFGRELVDDIEERSPFGIFTAIKAAFRVGKLAHNAIEQRKHHNKRSLESYEDLETREPTKGSTALKVFRAANKAANHAEYAHNTYQSMRQRELLEDELLEREFDEEYFEREFDDLD
jgi:hypothetical protein